MQKAAWAYEINGDYEEAIDMHKRIKEEYRNSNEGREADKYIAYLKGKI